VQVWNEQAKNQVKVDDKMKWSVYNRSMNTNKNNKMARTSNVDDDDDDTKTICSDIVCRVVGKGKEQQGGHKSSKIDVQTVVVAVVYNNNNKNN
jgi:hypothetical protein